MGEIVDYVVGKINNEAVLVLGVGIDGHLVHVTLDEQLWLTIHYDPLLIASYVILCGNGIITQRESMSTDGNTCVELHRAVGVDHPSVRKAMIKG